MNPCSYLIDHKKIVSYAELEEGGKPSRSSAPKRGEEADAGEQGELAPGGAALLVNTFALTKRCPLSFILPKHH